MLERLAEALPDLARRGWRDTYHVADLLKRLDADSAAPDERLVRLELRLLGVMDDVALTGRLSLALGQHPDLFVMLVTSCFRPDGGTNAEPTESEQRAANGARIILERWKGYPGIESPTPAERESQLLAWSEGVLDQLHAAGRISAAAYSLGEVLARAPAGDDGIWPCRAARRLMDTGRSKTLADGLGVAKRNLRGVTARAIGEGGPQEREIARNFAQMAMDVKDSSPATADMLRKLADSYVREAWRADENAEADRDEYDLGPLPAGPRVSRTVGEPQQSEPREFVQVLTLSGIRCFEQASLSLSPLTVVSGETGSGKSTLAEAFALFRSMATRELTADVDSLFGGMDSLLASGARDVQLGIEIGTNDSSSPRLVYELTLGRETDGSCCILRERLLERKGTDTRLLSEEHPSRSSRDEPPEVTAAFQRVRNALRGIEVHVAFDVSPGWSARAAARFGGVREPTRSDQGDRVHLFGGGIASAYAALRNRPTWSTEILVEVQRGITDVEDIHVRTQATTGHPVLHILRAGKLVPASQLGAGELGWLALVATLALAENTRTILVLDEPVPTAPLHLIAPLLERYASKAPLLYLTSSMGFRTHLSNSGRDLRITSRRAAVDGGGAIISTPSAAGTSDVKA